MGIQFNGVVGIDLSLTSTGLVRIGQDLSFDVAVITTKAATPMPLRQQEIAREILTRTSQGDLVLIEGYSFGSKGNATRDLPELGGIVKFQLNQVLGRYPVIIPPTTLKKFATGRGNVDKPAVAVAVYKRFCFEHPSNDVIDAYVLAQIGNMRLDRGPEPKAHERQILAKLDLNEVPRGKN